MSSSHPSGNLFEEISEQDMSLVAGGTNYWASKTAA
ncbi:plantaricin C family lantibiotic [Bacillus thuringiensis]|nr:plantaricin C family lantibiotic [Bacillus thuringiensis]